MVDIHDLQNLLLFPTRRNSKTGLLSQVINVITDPDDSPAAANDSANLFEPQPKFFAEKYPGDIHLNKVAPRAGGRFQCTTAYWKGQVPRWKLSGYNHCNWKELRILIKF